MTFELKLARGFTIALVRLWLLAKPAGESVVVSFSVWHS